MVSCLLLAGLAGGMCSCGRIGRLVEGKPKSTAIPPIPPQLQGRGGQMSEPVTRVTLEEPGEVTTEQVEKLRSREADLVWTDPDNPEEELEGMAEVIAQGARRGPWQVSYSEARRASMREGKPMVVWFTDTQSSPLCKALSAEVFSKGGFGSWAGKEVVRLRLDFNVKGVSRGPGHSAMDDRVRKINYLESLKKRYKVLGLPTVLVMAPDGTVTGRYRGYQRTYGDFYLKRLQGDAGAARQHHVEWMQKMGRRGYRAWSDTKGRQVFAKLARYHDGELILVEPDGKRLKAREQDLCEADRDWIRREKEQRKRAAGR